MEFGKMIAEIKTTCSSLENQKKDLTAQLQEIDKKLSYYKAALDNLIMAGCADDQEPAPEQTSNRGKTVMYTHNGVTQPLSAWAKQTGINVKTLWHRLNSGWSIEDAFSKPTGNFGKRVYLNPRAQPHKVFAYDKYGNVIRQFVGIGDAARSLNIPVATIEKMIEHVPKEDQLRVRQYYLAYAG